MSVTQNQTREVKISCLVLCSLISSETACPIVNFVKISVNWGQVVLNEKQVCHFCEKVQSAEKPVISRVFGVFETVVVLWRSWHLLPSLRAGRLLRRL